MKPNRPAQKENSSSGLLRGILLGHLILLLHVVLLGGVGILVIFFRGIVAYMPLILVSGLILMAGMAYLLFRGLKARKKRLMDILSSPALSGKSIEISLLGGMATIKLDSKPDYQDRPLLNSGTPPERGELIGTSHVLEDDLIPPGGGKKTRGKHFH